MKKLFTLLLALAMTLSLFACADSGSGDSQPADTAQATEAASASTLLAGFGRMSINPESPVGMGGYSDSETRKSGVILDNIYTTCVSFQEGDQTILVYTIEVCGLSDSGTENIRTRVSTATGVPNENIFIGATHTHSAPVLGDDNAWDTLFYNACINAAI